MKNLVKLTLIIFIAAGIFTSCKKDESRPNPTMSFVTDAGYTFQDVSLNEGDTARVGLDCNWNGTDLLTSLKQYYNDDLAQTTPFTTPFESGILTTTLTKTANETEKYTFEVIDANGQKTSLSLTLANPSKK